MARKKTTPEEELELAKKLEKKAKEKIAAARKKIKEQEEKEALKLAKLLIKTYKTNDFETIKEKIIEENTTQPTITNENLEYIRYTAEKLRNGQFLNYKDVFEEIKKRF